MKKSLFSILFSFVVTGIYALTYTVTVPAETNECYIAGAFTGWSQEKMTKIAGNTYQMEYPEATASQGYKYCSGPGWQYVEKSETGAEIGDRKWAESDVVANWAAVYDPNAIPGDITITVNVPEDTPDGEVYIVGSFQGWNTADAVKLDKIEDFVYRITIPDVTVFMYKMLCGLSFVNEEVTADGNSIQDRKAEISSPNVTITVEKWKNTGGASNEGYTYLPDNFDFSPLQGTRRIWVYLPPDYETNTEKYYPVLYMHDGQNVFENGGYGSWRVQDALNELYNAGKEVGIVVAIDNGPGRLSEYSPFPGNLGSDFPGSSTTGDGDKYLEAIITNIIPYINQNYRTLTDRDNTGICGSSMGGLISYYAALKQESLFGRIGIVSPAFWYCQDDLTEYVNQWTGDFTGSTRMYFICGDSESQSMVPVMQDFYDLTKTKGYADSNLAYEVVIGGEHNEKDWAAQITRIYEFLFLNTHTGISQNKKNNDVEVLSDRNSIKITSETENFSDVTLFDISGRLIKSAPIASGMCSIFDLSKGLYVVKVNGRDTAISKKVAVY